MRAGALDRRIVIERATVAPNAFNELVETWASRLTVWAGKVDVSDRERWAAQEIGAEVTTRFLLRFSSGAKSITPKDRIIYDGKVYNITAVKEIGRREGIEITASARSDQGL